MNYAIGCAFNFDELFYNFPNKKLSLTSKQCDELNNDRHKSKYIKKIFRDSMKLIITDIIENNVTFELPTGGKKADLHVERISGDLFKLARLRGAFLDIDILKSFFTANQLTFTMYSNNRTRKKPIYLNKEFKQKLIDYTHQGKLYC